MTIKTVLDRELCEKLVQSTSLIIGHNVLMTDASGRVLASNDASRVGTLHEASIEVIKSGQKAYHDSSAAKRLIGTRPGMTIPIFLNADVIGTIGITGSPQEISRFALLIQRMSQIFLSFQSQQQTSAQIDSRKQSLLREIVTFDKRTRAPSAVYASAYELGIDLNLPRAAVLVEAVREGPVGDSPHPPSPAMDRLTQLFHGSQDFVCSQGEGEYVVLAFLQGGARESSLEQLLQTCRQLEELLLQDGLHLRCGVGSAADSLETLRQSYENASFALRLLQSGVRQGSCLSIGEAVLERLAVHLPDQICSEIEESFFRPIFQSKNYEETMELIGHWCRLRFHFSQTAQALHIHKSTLVYRFHRIQELYGLDLYDFDRVIALYLLDLKRKLS